MAGPSRLALAGAALVQLLVAIYGGYFGGGIGILMLAILTMLPMKDIHSMNAVKTVLAAAINGMAIVTFVLAKAVVWPQAVLMVFGAMAGGYAGARYAQRLDPRWVRAFVIVVGLSMSGYFMLKY
jgi:uncharacterized membrane protein YfcA